MKTDQKLALDLIAKAIAAREFSYSPYSNFKVGAALLTKSGKVFTGCNVESVSYSPTTCAERVAILKAVSEGEREFSVLAVIGGHADGAAKTESYAGPCGVCRQLIYEFGPDTVILIAKDKDQYHEHTISELYPLGFGPEFLIEQ